ncbi:hypothetical protein ACWDTI_24315 [Gordonia sp. NPDC003424]
MTAETRAADVPALSEMSIREMIDATPLGPILDRPVGEVLAGLGLPPLPHVPALPPMPGLPPLPPLDLGLLVKPLTDLLGGFGTGDLSGSDVDPSAILQGLCTVLETSVSLASSAAKALDKTWTGTASAAAVGKSAQTTADTGRVATQGIGISIDIQAAAAIVGAGLATLQGIIAATIGKIAGTVPILATPAGQSLAVGFAGEGLAEATAAVATTRTQLLGPTSTMTTNGAPVSITHAPSPGASTPSPFAVAGAVLDAIGPAVSAMSAMARPPSTTTPDRTLSTAVTTPTAPTPTADPPTHVVTGLPAALSGAGPIAGGGGGVGERSDAGGVPTAGVGPTETIPTSLSAPRTSSTPVPGPSEPTGPSAQPAPRPAGVPAAGVPAPMAPMSAAGAWRAAGASTDQHATPGFLVTGHNGTRLVGAVAEVAPAVLGHDEPDIPPDVELRIGPR